jgi:hypothetical protein
LGGVEWLNPVPSNNEQRFVRMASNRDVLNRSMLLNNAGLIVKDSLAF